jgi:hypothetical protein
MLSEEKRRSGGLLIHPDLFAWTYFPLAVSRMGDRCKLAASNFVGSAAMKKNSK